MKEINADLRPTSLTPVIRELERAGARGITVIRVDAIGAAVDEETNEHRFFPEYDEQYSAVAKLEIICADTDAARFVGIIQRLAHRGARGQRPDLCLYRERGHQHPHPCARRGGALTSDFRSPESVNRLSAAEVGNTAAVCIL